MAAGDHGAAEICETKYGKEGGSCNGGRRGSGPQASLLTTWTLPAAAQIALQASPHNIRQLNKPTISTSPGTVIEHKTVVTFYCSTPDVSVKIYWVFNNVPLVPNERMQLSANDTTLTILTVQREDAGVYQCEVWGEGEIQSSNIVLLEVNYGPDPVEIKVESGELNGEVVEVMEGSTVKFHAETQSHPEATYTWYLPNASVLDLTTRTFTIPEVSKTDAGIYRCLVYNSVTSLSQMGALKVQVLGSLTKPQVVSLSLDFVENTNSTTLTCQTLNEEVGVRWFVGGQPLLPSERLVLSTDNRTLEIRSLWRDDSGSYQCEIWTGALQAWSDPFELTVSYGPDSVHITKDSVSGALGTVEVKLGSNLTLQCWAESQPGAEYHWSCEHPGWYYAGAQLVIQTVTWGHRGVCNCTAYNTQTSLALSASVLLSVVGPQPSSPSAGIIAGTVIGVLIVIALVAGLGYYSWKAGWLSRILADDPQPRASKSTFGRKHSAEGISGLQGPFFVKTPESQEHPKVGEVFRPASPDARYERVPPPAFTFGLHPENQFPRASGELQRPSLPEADGESNYQQLINPDADVYCQINLAG
ncbi:carcinoembryonic antigen-related cell adhesion molecule 20 [Cavia porcellus]|uniref:carcinoembryonic antigen-related cell adhesion molecule 20 n=1 Tax=Cavia porcellus TaxID=10141 RepID=UPI002FDF22AC